MRAPERRSAGRAMHIGRWANHDAVAELDASWAGRLAADGGGRGGGLELHNTPIKTQRGRTLIKVKPTRTLIEAQQRRTLGASEAEMQA